MRKPIIVGNWKMNKTCAEAVSFINEIEPKLHDGADYGIAAPFTALKDCVNTAKGLIVAAENCHFEDNGAFTGEVSVPVSYTHLERGISKALFPAVIRFSAPAVCDDEGVSAASAGVLSV